MENNGNASPPGPKKTKTSASSHPVHKDMSDIITLLKLSTDEGRMRLVSNYIETISEFILHEAEEICRTQRRKKISVEDIKNVIVSRDLFFLSDLLDLCK